MSLTNRHHPARKATHRNPPKSGLFAGAAVFWSRPQCYLAIRGACTADGAERELQENLVHETKRLGGGRGIGTASARGLVGHGDRFHWRKLHVETRVRCTCWSAAAVEGWRGTGTPIVCKVSRGAVLGECVENEERCRSFDAMPGRIDGNSSAKSYVFSPIAFCRCLFSFDVSVSLMLPPTAWVVLYTRSPLIGRKTLRLQRHQDYPEDHAQRVGGQVRRR